MEHLIVFRERFVEIIIFIVVILTLKSPADNPMPVFCFDLSALILANQRFLGTLKRLSNIK